MNSATVQSPTAETPETTKEKFRRLFREGIHYEERTGEMPVLTARGANTLLFMMGYHVGNLSVETSTHDGQHTYTVSGTLSLHDDPGVVLAESSGTASTEEVTGGDSHEEPGIHQKALDLASGRLRLRLALESTPAGRVFAPTT